MSSHPHYLDHREGWMDELIQKGFSREDADEFLNKLGFYMT
jgi:hypothetical protein